MDNKYLKPESTRLYSYAFLACLVVIGILVGATYIVVTRIIDQGAIASDISRVGKDQKSLAFKIVSGAVAYANNPYAGPRIEQRENLKADIMAMKKTHRILTQGDPANGIPIPESDAIDAIIYDNPHQLDEEVKRFLFAANEIITHEWSPDLVRIVYLQEMTARIDGELLYGLNSLVNQLSLESQKKIKQLRLVTASMAALTLLALIIMWIFVFQPLLRRLSEQTQSLIEMARTTL